MGRWIEGFVGEYFVHGLEIFHDSLRVEQGDDPVEAQGFVVEDGQADEGQDQDGGRGHANGFQEAVQKG